MLKFVRSTRATLRPAASKPATVQPAICGGTPGQRARILAACALLAVTSMPVLASTPINESRPLDPRGRVDIENLKGRIQVRAWDRAEVKIEGNLGAGVEMLEITGDRERLAVRVKYPNRGGGLGFLVGGDKSEPTDLRLMVPLQAGLEIDSVSADIDVSGVAPDELSIDSVSGDVTVAGAPLRASIDSVSGDLALTLNRSSVNAATVSGDIHLRGRLGTQIAVETVSGNIDVAAIGAALRELAGATVSGDMRIGAALAGNGDIKLESVSGDIDLTLPRNLSARVSAQSFSGDLQAPGADIQRTRHGPGSGLEHRYGSGSGEVSIETFSGDARLQLD